MMMMYRPVFLGPKSNRRSRTRRRWILCKPTEARCSARASQSIADPCQLLAGGDYRLRTPPNTTTARLSLVRWSRRSSSCRHDIIIVHYIAVVYRAIVLFFRFVFTTRTDRVRSVNLLWFIEKKKAAYFIDERPACTAVL